MHRFPWVRHESPEPKTFLGPKLPKLKHATLPTGSTARITPRAKQPRCVGRDDSYARFVWFFAQGRLTHEMNCVFALSYIGERYFVVVFKKRSMIFGLSRTTMKTRECAGFYKTNKARLSLFSQRMSSSASGNSWGVLQRRAPVPHEQLLFHSRILSTVAIHFKFCRQFGWQKRL